MCYLTCAKNEQGIGSLPYRTPAILAPPFPETFSKESDWWQQPKDYHELIQHHCLSLTFPSRWDSQGVILCTSQGITNRASPLEIHFTTRDSEVVADEKKKNLLLCTLSMHQKNVSKLLRIYSKNVEIMSGLGKKVLR